MNKHFAVALCTLSLGSVTLSQAQVARDAPVAPPVADEDERLVVLQEDSARISLSAPKTQYVGGEYIKVDIILKNVGTKSFRFIPLDADWFYQIEVINPDGKKAPLLGTSTRRTEASETGGVVPNGSKTLRTWLSNIFDMTTEGTYIITVSKRFKLGAKVITAKSEPLRLDVISTPTISEWK